MGYLADGEPAQNLVISKGGEGRLYYRLAMSYAPANLILSSADYGFAVDRSMKRLISLKTFNAGLTVVGVSRQVRVCACV